MNNILYNISLIVLGSSVLLYFMYFLKLLKRKPSKQTIYDVRPNKVFTKMFTSPPILQTYEDLDQNDPVYKLFVR